jgi:serine/threonine protein kinase
MVAAHETRESALRTFYAERPGDTLHTFLRSIGTTDDDSVADWIMADATVRSEMGGSIAFEELMPILIAHGHDPVLIDTAIDAVVRSEVARGRTESEALDALLASHPDLSEAIQTARALGSLFRSSAAGRGREGGIQPLALPIAVGPSIEPGRARYELIERLGVGSQGEVLLAVDRQLSNADHPAWVAVKVAKHRTNPESPALETLRSEALRARRVQHPNVVRVSDFGATPDNRAFVVYEHIAGENLHNWRQRQRAGPDRALVIEFVRQIARGVQGIHTKGLVHGDLKPSNVLVGVDRRLLVADLGLARSLTPGSDRLDAHALGAGGTVGFMAPEQIGLPEEPGIAADIYALGGLLFWLLTDKAPNGDSTEEAVAYLRSSPAEQSDAVRRRVSVIQDLDLRKICERALSPRPQDRHGSADAFESDLATVERHEVLAWSAPTTAHRFRLLLKRQPMTVAIVAATLVAMLVAVFALVGTHIKHKEREWQLQLEAATLKAEEADHRLDQARVTVRSAINAMRNLRTRDGEEGLAHGLALLEITIGPTFMEVEGSQHELWEARVEVARRKRAEGTRGGTVTLEGMHWAMLEGMWAAQLGRLDEGLAGAELAVNAFSRILPESDPWLIRARGSLAAIVVLILDEDRRGVTPESRRELAEQVKARYELDALRAEMDRALELERHLTFSTSTVGRFVARSGMRLYAPNWLADPIRMEQMLDLLKKF